MDNNSVCGFKVAEPKTKKEVFDNVVLIEFPLTFVGSSSSQTVEPPILKHAGPFHIVAYCKGKLMTLCQAQNESHIFNSFRVSPTEGECEVHKTRHLHVEFKPQHLAPQKGWHTNVDSPEGEYVIELRLVQVACSNFWKQPQMRVLQYPPRESLHSLVSTFCEAPPPSTDDQVMEQGDHTDLPLESNFENYNLPHNIKAESSTRLEMQNFKSEPKRSKPKLKLKIKSDSVLHKDRHSSIEIKAVPKTDLQKKKMSVVKPHMSNLIINEPTIDAKIRAKNLSKNLRSRSKAVISHASAMCVTPITEPKPEVPIELARIYVRACAILHNLSHDPITIDFGQISPSGSVERHLIIHNNCELLSVELEYEKVSGIFVKPSRIKILPLSLATLIVRAQPSSPNLGKELIFTIYGPSLKAGVYSRGKIDIYKVTFSIEIVMETKIKLLKEDAYRGLRDIRKDYTYTSSELKIVQDHKAKNKIMFKKVIEEIKMQNNNTEEKSDKYLISCKIDNFIASSETSFIKKEFKVYDDSKRTKFIAEDLRFIKILPDYIDFGNVVCGSKVWVQVIFSNSGSIPFNLRILKDDKLKVLQKKNITVYGMSEETLSLSYFSNSMGYFEFFLTYCVEDNYYFHLPCYITVKQKILEIDKSTLTIGHTTSTVQNIVIYNKFNVDDFFTWKTSEYIKVLPNSGVVPGNGNVMCEIEFCAGECKLPSNLVLEYSTGIIDIPIIKYKSKSTVVFMSREIDFQEIPINVRSVQEAYVYNNGPQIAMIDVSPYREQIPGVTVTLQSNIISPKCFIKVMVTILFPFPSSFSFGLNFIVNSKEKVVIKVKGHTIFPRLIINPEHIQNPRLPAKLRTKFPFLLKNTNPVSCIISFEWTNSNFEVCRDAFGLQVVDELYLNSCEDITLYLIIDCQEPLSYDFYLPIKINNLVGPPQLLNTSSHDPNFYWEELFEEYREFKFVLEAITRKVPLLRITGTICSACIKVTHTVKRVLSYLNKIPRILFTIFNCAVETITINFIMGSLQPYYTMISLTPIVSTVSHVLKISVRGRTTAELEIFFYPSGPGRFIAESPFYLNNDSHVLFHNVYLDTHYLAPKITLQHPSREIYLLPMDVNDVYHKVMNIVLHDHGGKIKIDHKCFPLTPELKIEYIQGKTYEIPPHSGIIPVKITVQSDMPMSAHTIVIFKTSLEATFELDIHFSFDDSIFTTHFKKFSSSETNTYPFFPSKNGNSFYKYMQSVKKAMESWLFEQGFGRCIYPRIPYGLHLMSETMIEQERNINYAPSCSIISLYQNLLGSGAKKLLAKYHRTCRNTDKVWFIYSTYKNILELLLGQGAVFIHVRPEYLLKHEEYLIYLNELKNKSERMTPVMEAMKTSKTQYNSLSKQCWLDVMLQTYKVFIYRRTEQNIVSETSICKDMRRVFIAWYNKIIVAEHNALLSMSHKNGKNKLKIKKITNLMQDLQDGVALIAVTHHYCPYITSLLNKIYYPANTDEQKIQNILKVTSVWKQMHINFGTNPSDILEGNHIYLLILSVHLFLILPQHKPRMTLEFRPKLCELITKQITFQRGWNDTIVYTLFFIGNEYGNFSVNNGATTLSLTDNNPQTITISYQATHVRRDSGILLACGDCIGKYYGENIVILVEGEPGKFDPTKTISKKTQIYKPIKVSLKIPTPIKKIDTYHVWVTEEPPCWMTFEDYDRKISPKLSAKRINIENDYITTEILDTEMVLSVPITICCLSTKKRRSWLIFRSKTCDFVVVLNSEVELRMDTEIITASLKRWPLKQCACGLECQCYRTARVEISPRNWQQRNALRYCIAKTASPDIMDFFDRHFESPIGMAMLSMMISQTDCNADEVTHILERSATMNVTLGPTDMFEIKEEVKIPNLLSNQPIIFTIVLSPKYAAMSIARDRIAKKHCKNNALTIFQQEKHLSMILFSSCGREYRKYSLQLKGVLENLQIPNKTKHMRRKLKGHADKKLPF